MQYCRKTKAAVPKNVSCPHAQKDALSDFPGVVEFSQLTQFCEIQWSNFGTKVLIPPLQVMNVSMSESVQALFVQVYVLLTAGQR